MRASNEQAKKWKAQAETYCGKLGASLDDVTSLATAWNIAHYSGIVKEAYDCGLNDIHIETVLKRIFSMKGEQDEVIKQNA